MLKIVLLIFVLIALLVFALVPTAVAPIMFAYLFGAAMVVLLGSEIFSRLFPPARGRRAVNDHDDQYDDFPVEPERSTATAYDADQEAFDLHVIRLNNARRT